MTEPTDKSFETNNQIPDFKAQIDAITERSLSPENIDTYADDALNDLIDIVSSVVTGYEQDQTIVANTNQEVERQAFMYRGLDANTVEATLDHIADLAADISKLDDFIKQHANNGNVVITPPMLIDQVTTSGSGSFKERARVPRLKTILLLLERQFAIDLEDSAQIRIVPGKVTSGMMRQIPYNMIDLPTLNRIINVCDEEGNRTFLFDRENLLALGLEVETIAHLEKPELDLLIDNHQGVGCALRYDRTTFVRRIAQLLRRVDNSHLDDTNADKLLKQSIELAPEGFLSLKKMATEYADKKIAYATYQKAFEVLRSEMGEINSYRFGSKTAEALSPAQQHQLIKFIESQRPPEGYMSIRHISEEQGISRSKLAKQVEGVRDQLGEVKTYYHRGEPVEIYSPEQQHILLSAFDRDTYVRIPENYKWVSEIADELQVGRKIVEEAFRDLADRIGVIGKYKGDDRRHPSNALSPEQQEVIRDYFNYKRRLDSRESIFALSKRSNLGRFILRRVATELESKGELGRVLYTKSGHPVYNSAQAERIINTVHETSD